MKLTLVLLTILGATAHADLAHLNCTVAEVSGQIISYLPPRTNDSMTLDLSGNQISHLTFRSGNMVPILVPLNKKVIQPGSMFQYSATQDDSSTESQALTVLASNMVSYFRVEVQQVNTDKTTGLVTTGDLVMTCTGATTPR